MFPLALLGNNQAKLVVSDDYLAFAQEYGIEEYLDLAWLRNAFVADYVAQILTERGYISCYLASFDGYTRSLKDAGELDFNVFQREGMDIYAPAKMSYNAPIGIVALRDHPLSDLDRWNYRVYTDGSITSSMIDPADGTCGTAISNLVCYGAEASCARILMEMLPVMFAESFSDGTLTEMTGKGIYSIWCSNGVVCFNQQEARLELLENEAGISYKIEYKP